ncbi:transmembrane protein, putative [Bodo saltans]|uniref:Transmembrane protein, putative n=1 Tax=Bodo saltans TaxID=75058 RepID=A0A0S4IZB6_BODSA|nr:transmembrane protein, putative [Bodo saltans]|eukprot:CUG31425.1 transmembrane protein, putative [Bodo saltans]
MPRYIAHPSIPRTAHHRPSGIVHRRPRTGGQRRTCAFKGWVGHITKDTVTMIDAIRFEDVAALHDASLHIELESLPPLTEQPSPLPLAAAVRRLPYASFARRKIRDVKFEANTSVLAPSRSQAIAPFLNAVQSPEWFPHDAQKVRMFLRQFIVHAAQSSGASNEEMVDGSRIASFLSARLSVPQESIDLVLVQRYAKEEADDLCIVDKDIVDFNEQRRQQHADEAVDHTLLAIPPVSDSGTTARRTGANLVRGTVSVAVVEFVCAIALMVYSASLFQAVTDPMLLEFIRPGLIASLSAGGIFVAASLCTIVHMLCGRATKSPPWKFILRTVVILLSLFGGANSFTKHIRYCFAYMDPTGTRLFNYYRSEVAEHGDTVCRMFQDYKCSGWATPCGNGTRVYLSSNGADCPAPSCAVLFPTPCSSILEIQVRNICIPLLVMTAITSLLAVVDGVMLIRLRRHVSLPTDEPETATLQH